MRDEKLFNQISESVSPMPVFDTHEHLMHEEERRQNSLDVFYLFSHYVASDLGSSGMTESDYNRLFDQSIDISKRWEIFFPHFENVKNTSYTKIVLESIKDLFGIEELNENTYIELSKKLEDTKKINWYDKVLNEKSNIRHMLNFIENMPGINNQEPQARKDMVAVKNFEDIICICCMEDIFRLEQKYSVSIYSLKDYLSLIDRVFEESADTGYKVLKIVIAYFRTINFEETSLYDAEIVFSRIFKLKDYGFFERVDFLSKDELKPLQDFLVHYIIQKAIAREWPVQIHTGLLNGNRGDVSNTNPCFLNNLFLKYRNCRFDIFHAGFPYSQELITIAKQFANVYFDFCWIQQVSFDLYRDILNLAIETIPSNKIFAFGGDNFIVECTYGSIKKAKEIISGLLYRKVSEGYFSFEDAVKLAEKILYSNPAAVYTVK
ncbi:MAG: Uronate isomerase [Actinobacteria bacterium ADurb.Bin346]|nr:MAG: Uronate isomerase [Actinobacteria bacterium ADurb.Bin346]